MIFIHAVAIAAAARALAVAVPGPQATTPCVAAPAPTTVTPSTGGSGPYTSYFFADPSLPSHVIYQPKVTTNLKLPVVIWGNGQCYGDGTIFQAFLGQVASYGVFVIAGGVIGTGGNPNALPPVTAANLKAAIDWVTKTAGTGNYTQVDTSRLAVWGQSCGGTLAIAYGADTRVTSVGIFNSGSGLIGGATSAVSSLKKPIFYFLGGPCDIAYAAGEADYKAIPAGNPVWKGNLPVGHTATFPEKDAGRFGLAGAHLADWVLRGNATAAQWFTGGGAAEGWDEVYHDLDKIKVTPI